MISEVVLMDRKSPPMILDSTFMDAKTTVTTSAQATSDLNYSNSNKLFSHENKQN